MRKYELFRIINGLVIGSKLSVEDIEFEIDSLNDLSASELRHIKNGVIRNYELRKEYHYNGELLGFWGHEEENMILVSSIIDYRISNLGGVV